MAEVIRDLARRIFLCDLAQEINVLVGRIGQRWELQRWEKAQRTLPPPHTVKQRTVRAYAAAFSLDTLVETGTYLGAMIDATRETFRRIYSIELDSALYRRARRRYAPFGHITVLQGDSGEVLANVLAGLREPALFWLDAHHSGVLTARARLESPIMQEVQHILGHLVMDHVILIDDAHAFVGQGGYPTVAQLQQVVARRRPGWALRVADDIIRIHRPPTGGS